MIMSPKDSKLILVYLEQPEFRTLRFKMSQAIKSNDSDAPITNEMILGFKACVGLFRRKLTSQTIDIPSGQKIVNQHLKNLDRLELIFL